MSQAKIVIKKYGNRRLYDTARSRYVNLDDVAQLVREGADIQVIDANSGQDRTRAVLSQIILEETGEHEPSLPLELLRQMVKATDSAGRRFLEWYLKNAMDAYERVSHSLLGPIGPGAPPPKPNPNEEIQALHQRLEELEKRLADKQRPRKKDRKAARKR